ncbi:hypothetical protein WJX72_012523 [[Myrmecia] bisecta]|uniref:WW domain-containing protein n=1 Tax=[Myrmecia] bisecta TaxID=41462 RepID=A0AAW1QGR0_9CHLO
MVGRVIGKGGETIRSLQTYTGSTIQIDQSAEPTRVTIAGSPQSVQLAVSMVNDIVQGSFKGFAMLRQISGAGAGAANAGPAAAVSQLHPVYIEGFGFVPPSQFYSHGKPPLQMSEQQQALEAAQQLGGHFGFSAQDAAGILLRVQQLQAQQDLAQSQNVAHAQAQADINDGGLSAGLGSDLMAAIGYNQPERHVPQSPFSADASFMMPHTNQAGAYSSPLGSPNAGSRSNSPNHQVSPVGSYVGNTTSSLSSQVGSLFHTASGTPVGSIGSYPGSTSVSPLASPRNSSLGSSATYTPASSLFMNKNVGGLANPLGASSVPFLSSNLTTSAPFLTKALPSSGGSYLGSNTGGLGGLAAQLGPSSLAPSTPTLQMGLSASAPNTPTAFPHVRSAGASFGGGLGFGSGAGLRSQNESQSRDASPFFSREALSAPASPNNTNMSSTLAANGWLQLADPEGRKFYINQVTGQTQWNCPQ